MQTAKLLYDWVEMEGDRPTTDLAQRRSASADLWKHTLSQIPTNLGRIVYLASLRNPNSGRYEHHGLRLVFGQAAADQLLRETHTEQFLQWIQLSLEQKKADLDLYLSTQEESRSRTVETWLRLKTYKAWAPASRRSMERKLFWGDLEALLELIKNEAGAVGRIPDASPRR